MVGQLQPPVAVAAADGDNVPIRVKPKKKIIAIDDELSMFNES